MFKSSEFIADRLPTISTAEENSYPPEYICGLSRGGCEYVYMSGNRGYRLIERGISRPNQTKSDQIKYLIDE